jgi:glycosyltransferase involved in cell wall biosynthesis
MERHGYEALQRDLLSRATLLLPNSRAELDLLHENFPETRNIPASIVPNGVERSMFARETPGNLPEASGARNPFVLCVGRIEPRKNQLNLVTALSETSLPVVMVGRISHRAYAEAVRRAMKASDRIIAAVDPAQLVAFYCAAQVHAQPSFYETPGLASLEAAATGCPIVVTGRGSQREYFGDNAFYCDPFLPESINSAVLRAWNREPLQEDLRETIQQQYTWDVAAKRTCEAYQMILGQSRSGIHV